MSHLLKSSEAAALLRVHPKHLYRLLRQGLPARRVGGHWRFSREELLAWDARAPEPRPAPPPLLAANGDCAVELLLELLLKRTGEPMGFVQADKTSAGRALADGRVLVAGAHGPTPEDAPASFATTKLDLVDRQVGLAFPKRLALRSLDRVPSLRVASRPRTAGVRAHFDAALQRAGLDPRAVAKRSVEVGSHRDVVLAVVQGSADVGIASAAWAERAGLAFLAFATERYALTFSTEHANDPRVEALVATARSSAYQRGLRGLAGTDPSPAGRLRAG